MEPLKQENRVFNPPADFVKNAAIPGMDAYKSFALKLKKIMTVFGVVLPKRISIGKSPLLKF